MDLGRAFIERAKAEPLDGIPGSSGAIEPWTVYTQALLLSNEFLFID
jgi:hypothetical protein